MLAADEVRALVQDNAISDEEALAIRDACYELAGIIVTHWMDRRANRTLSP